MTLTASGPRAAAAGVDPLAHVLRMEDHDAAYDHWKAGGIRDAVLLHFDGHLDFYWIPERDPSDLLRARSAAELDRLINDVSLWNWQGTSLRENVHIGNFIYPAIRDGIVSQFYWVVPDPFWSRPPGRRAVRRFLEDLTRLNPRQSGPVTEDERMISTRLLGCPLVVGPLESLPAFREPVLLDLDVDYLCTWDADDDPPYFDAMFRGPWITPSRFAKRLSQARIPCSVVTISDSVNGGYTPQRLKFYGTTLQRWLQTPDAPAPDAPEAGTADATYREFELAAAAERWAPARAAWHATVRANASFRNPYACPAYRLEMGGRWTEALAWYQRLVLWEPDWVHAHLGLGKALWRMGRRSEAESAFQRARELAPGPTTSTYWLGECAYARHSWAEASRQWERAIHEDPRDGASREALARLALRTGAWAEAADQGRRCLQLGFDTPRVRAILARAAWKRGKRRIAVAQWRQSAARRWEFWKDRWSARRKAVRAPMDHAER
ncbi:MAG TPA: UPF0489 family protein [Elusimicrobiota bacterium]|nr:UPF0489 family protein [Elusimicrobiota bacterium]